MPDITKYDGEYEVAIVSDIHDVAPGFYQIGDAHVRLTNGVIEGADQGGVTFFGTATIANDTDPHDINIELTVDPTKAVSNAVIMHYDGSLKREPVTHNFGMKAVEIGGSFRFSCTLNIGPLEVNATLRPKV